MGGTVEKASFITSRCFFSLKAKANSRNECGISRGNEPFYCRWNDDINK